MTPLVLAPLLLVIVLALSGALKLRDTRSTRDAFTSLRLPEALTASSAPVLLPYAELLLALLLLLLPGPLGIVCAIAAAVLMACYLVVVARALRFEVPVTCSCFGKLGLGEVTGVTLARNGVLLALALVGVVQAWHGDSLLEQLLALDGPGWGWVAMSLVAALLARLIAHRGSTAPPGSFGDEADYFRHPIPFGQLRMPDGSLKALQQLPERGAVLLVFLNYGCPSCIRVMERLPAFVAANPELETYGVFYEQQHEQVHETDIGVPVLLDPSGTTAYMFGIGSPGAVLLGADGLLAGGPVRGEDGVVELLSDISDQLAETR